MVLFDGPEEEMLYQLSVIISYIISYFSFFPVYLSVQTCLLNRVVLRVFPAVLRLAVPKSVTQGPW